MQIKDGFIPIHVSNLVITQDGAWTGVGQIVGLPSEPGNTGILRLQTAQSTGSHARLFKAPSGWESGSNVNSFPYDAFGRVAWRARVSDVSGIAWVAALQNKIQFAGAGADNIGFRYDTNVDADLRCVTMLDGVLTETLVMMPSDGGFHDYVVEFDAANALFYVDGVLVATHAANLPVGSLLTPYSVIFARASAARNLDLDLFELD